MARPSRLTPELQSEVVRYLRRGASVQLAASLAKIGRQTFYDWLRRGGAGEEPFAEFAAEVEHAMAVAEYRAMRKVLAGKRGWISTGWWLERVHPERYRLHNRTEITGADGGPVQLNASADDDLIRKLREIARRGTGEEPSAGSDSGGAQPG